MYVGTFPGALQLESSVAISINVSAATPQMHSRAGQHTKLKFIFTLPYITTTLYLPTLSGTNSSSLEGMNTYIHTYIHTYIYQSIQL